MWIKILLTILLEGTNKYHNVCKTEKIIIFQKSAKLWYVLNQRTTDKPLSKSMHIYLVSFSLASFCVRTKHLKAFLLLADPSTIAKMCLAINLSY